MDADQHVDLDPPRERSGDEQRATAALSDLADAPGLEGAGGPAALATVRQRAVRRQRQHRRSVAGGVVLGVAATAALALVVPAVVPDVGGRIVAALGADEQGATPGPSEPAPDGSGSPDPDLSDAPPAPVGLPVLSDPDVAAFAAGVDPDAEPPVADGALALLREPRSARIGDVGGWCRDTPLVLEYPAGSSWAVAWQAPDAGPDAEGTLVGERVLSWGGGGPASPFMVEGARAYVAATAASDVRCTASSQSGAARTFSVLPEPSPGVVQAVAPVGGSRSAWEVRTVTATGAGNVVDLTVVLPAASGPEAGAAAAPLVQSALESAGVWEATSEFGPSPLADPSLNAPGSVVQDYRDGQLTLEQVQAVLPGAAYPEPVEDDPVQEIVVGCNAPFFIPRGATNPESSASIPFEAPGAGGTVSVTARLLRYEDATAQDYVSATNDPATVCDPAAAGQTWEAVTLRHAGESVDTLVRHPDGDPRRWVVRTAVTTDPATAVDLEVGVQAASQDEVAAIVQPLLQRAAQNAYEANFVPSAP